MSPTKRDAGAAYQAAPDVVTDGPNKTDDHHLEEKSAAPLGAMDQMLAMLGDLSDRMNRMEVARNEQVGKDQKGSPESIFGSALGVGAGMSLQALEHTPPPKRSPNVSPATYFMARRQANIGGRPADHIAEDFNMGQFPEPVIHRQEAHAGYVPGGGIPNRMYVHPGPQVAGMPDAQHRKLALQPFDGKELYHGLGSGFLEWGKEFVRQVGFAERACGFAWPEDIKVDVLGQHLAGKAQTYYRRQVETWWVESQTLEHAMQRLLQTFNTKISPAQSMKLFTAPKASHRSWTDHFLYLTAVSDACGGADSLVLDNIVHYADPHMRMTMLSRLDMHRTDPLRQAEELAQFAQSTEVDTHAKNLGRDVVNAVEPRKDSKDKVKVKVKTKFMEDDERKCYKCGEVGHIRSRCPQSKKKISRHDFTFAIGNGGGLQDDHWILDSGSSRHLVNDLSLLVDPEDCHSECLTAAADGGVLRVSKRGSVDIKVVALGTVNTIRLLDVQYAANLERNIISYGKLEAKGCVLEYRGGRRVLTSGVRGAPVMDVDCNNNVLVVKVMGGNNNALSTSQEAMMAVFNSPEYESDSDVQSGTLMQFHRRLGHLCFDTIIKMAKDPASAIKLTDTTRMKCLACAQGKQVKGAQSKKDTGNNSPIDVIGGVICSDLKGPMTPRDRLGNRYLVNFIDHRSNYCRVFLAKSKDVAALKFKHFLVSFEREFNCRIHVLRTDGGGEYKTLDMFCKATGVSRQVSEARNQASNGKAERMHRTIMNMVRSMVFASNLPLSFWGDAAVYAAYILNRSRTKSNPGGVSPMEFLTKKVPKLNDIVVFGSTCTVHVNARNKSLGERGKAAIIIGKSDETKGYKVYIPKDKVVVITQHVRNIETIDRQEETLSDDHADIKVQPGAKKRATKSRKAGKPEWTRERHGTRSISKLQAKEFSTEPPTEPQDVVNAVMVQDPKHYREAVKSDHREQWKIAMTEELDALKSNDVWSIVVPPKGAHVLHNKWVYKTKTDANGDIERYKARLVVCGNEQVFGVDYTLTFAAVMDLGTVKLILVLSRRWNVPARHGDVPNAYVKAEKEEHLDIYMKVPMGMILDEKELKSLGVKSSSDLALLLKKSLYGLKQAGRLWSKLLDSKLRQCGFQQCMTDMCLYYKYKDESCTVVGVYVDDLLVTGTEQSAVDEFFAEMSSLSIKDLGIVNKFLGLRIQLDDSNGYVLDQEVTIDLLLKEFGMESANGVRAPIGDECNEDDEDDLKCLPARGAEGEPSVKTFQSLVGSLLWIARCTRPDICFAVHKATRQTHKPTSKDWKTAKRIVRYLKMSKSLKLHLNGVGQTTEDVRIECWSDADFAADKVDRKSVSGCVVTMDSAVILWICKKQSGVSLSTMEAEFISASQAGRELLGTKELLNELKLRVREPMPMWIDNQAAIKQLESEKSTSSAKHVDIRFKFIRHYAQAGIVVPRFVKSQDMIADILTKALPAPRMEELRKMLKLKAAQHDTEEEC